MSQPNYLATQFSALLEQALITPPFNNNALDEPEQSFIDTLREVSQTDCNQDRHFLGQQLITRMVASYPQLMAHCNRDILWLLGGDALHYLSDDEISQYQHIEDLMYADTNAPLEFSQAKSKLLNLH